MMKNVKIIKSRRKTISIEVGSDLNVIVRAPIWASEHEIADFIEKREKWIEKAIDKMGKRQEMLEKEERLSKDEITALFEKARAVIPEKTKQFAKVIGVKYNKISVKNQSTRWGELQYKRQFEFQLSFDAVPGRGD